MEMSGLRLNSREALLKGGAHGPAVQPGDASKSRLYLAITKAVQPAMPPGKSSVSVTGTGAPSSGLTNTISVTGGSAYMRNWKFIWDNRSRPIRTVNGRPVAPSFSYRGPAWESD